MSGEINHNNWDQVIEPRRPLTDWRLRECWHYRDLLGLFIRRDLVATWKQTILGPLWLVLQPLLTTLVYVFIFGKLAGFSTDGYPRFLFFLAGITAWNYFADCLVKTSSVFKDHAHLFGKVYFPRLLVPVSVVAGGLIRFFIQLVFLLIAIGVYHFRGFTGGPTLYVWMLPVLVLLMAMLGLGIGLTITALTTRYRDLAYLVVFGVQLLMFATPVVYPLSMAPAAYRWIIELNPLSSVVEQFRGIFLGGSTPGLSALLYPALVSLGALITGMFLFQRAEQRFVDTI